MRALSIRKQGARKRGARKRRARKQKGAAVVELAIVSPVVFLLIFAIIEFGRMIMVQQVLTNASREGARRAILEQSTATSVIAHVNNYLASNTLSAAEVSVVTH